MLEKLMKELSLKKDVNMSYRNNEMVVDNIILKNSLNRFEFDKLAQIVQITDAPSKSFITNYISLFPNEIELLYYQAKALGWFE